MKEKKILKSIHRAHGSINQFSSLLPVKQTRFCPLYYGNIEKKTAERKPERIILLMLLTSMETKAVFVLGENHFRKCFFVNAGVWLRMENKFFENAFQLTMCWGVK